MKRKIKSKPLLFLLAIFVIAIIGGTFAYYYQNVSLPNQFKTMTYNVNLTEEFNNDWGVKKVYITNNDTAHSVVLRISYNEMWSKTIGNNVLTLSNTINGSNLVTKNWTTTFTNNFTDGLDGWYYYNLVLNPSDTIQILNSISLNSNLILNTVYYDDYMDYNYNLIFNYEAIEANSSTINSLWGKTATISNNTVNWT